MAANQGGQAPLIAKQHVFGCNSDVANGIGYAGEGHLVYTAGHNIVIYDEEKCDQRFIPGQEGPEGVATITALAVSPNRKFVAIAERVAEKPATVSVFDVTTLRRRKTLAAPEAGMDNFVCVTFSSDSKRIAAQSGAPDWKMVVWNWEAQSVESVHTSSSNVDHAIRHVCFSARDANVLALCGDHRLELWQHSSSDSALHPIALKQDKDFDFVAFSWTVMAWLGSNLLCGNSGGHVIQIRREAQYCYDCVVVSVPKTAVTSLAVMGEHTVAVGFANASVFILQKDPDDMKHQLHKVMAIELTKTRTPVVAIAASPDQKRLSCVLATQQLVQVETEGLDQLADEELAVTFPLGQFHAGPVTGLDTCVRKPYAVTCGVDRSVRLWNYVTRTQDVCKVFAEEAYSVAFHPSGLHILVGFADKLRLMNVLMDDLREYKVYGVRACRECRFSNGGHLLAAVNGDKIMVYNTYSTEQVAVLRGHSQRVRCLYWSRDDSRLVSAGGDGAVYEWDIHTQQRPQEYVERQCPVNAAVCSLDGKLYMVGQLPVLKEVVESQLEKEASMGHVFRQLAISHVPQRMMFAGAEDGFIRSFKFPLTGEQADYMAHRGAVTGLRLTHDDRYLFTVGEDGCLMVFEIREKAARVPEKRSKELAPGDEVVLVTVSDLEDKRMRETELRNKVDELQLHNEYQLRLKEMQYQDTLKEKTDRFQKELHTQKQTYEVLRDEKQDMEMEYEEKVKLKEDRHAEAVQNCEAEHQRGLMEEVERYHGLEQTLKREERTWEQNTLEKEEQHKASLERMQEEEADRLEEKVVYREMLQQQNDEIQRKYVETKNQMQEDMDDEIEEMKRKNERVLQDERDATLRLKGENGVMRKKFITLKNEIEEQKGEMRRMADQTATLKRQIHKLNDMIADENLKMTDRDKAIAVREKKVMELKKKNQNLEKHKFVLDHRIKDLKRQIEPRQNKISEMRSLVKTLDGRLEAMHHDHRDLQGSIETHSNELEAVYKRIARKRDRQRFLTTRVEEFSRDLYAAVQHIQDPERLLAAVEKLHETHMQGSMEVVATDPAITEEYERQKTFLKGSVDQMTKTLQAQKRSNRTEYLGILQQNMDLITEANELRGNLKGMEVKVAQTKSEPSTGGGSGWKREIEMQRQQLFALREEIAQVERTGVSNSTSRMGSARAV